MRQGLGMGLDKPIAQQQSPQHTDTEPEIPCGDLPKLLILIIITIFMVKLLITIILAILQAIQWQISLILAVVSVVFLGTDSHCIVELFTNQYHIFIGKQTVIMLNISGGQNAVLALVVDVLVYVLFRFRRSPINHNILDQDETDETKTKS